jgi:hypothetical protein
MLLFTPWPVFLLEPWIKYFPVPVKVSSEETRVGGLVVQFSFFLDLWVIFS